MGFGRGCVDAFAGILGNSGRPCPRHRPPIAPGRPSYFAARNLAASPAAQNRPPSCTAATAAPTNAAPTTTATPGSASAASGRPQSDATGTGATGRSGGSVQHHAQTGHHGRGQQRSSTYTRQRSCTSCTSGPVYNCKSQVRAS